MARNFVRIFTENNPVMGYSKTFFIPEAKGLRRWLIGHPHKNLRVDMASDANWLMFDTYIFFMYLKIRVLRR